MHDLGGQPCTSLAYLTQKGHVCWVVAPSLLPTKPGERVTTNRRDARKLARLRRSGDLTPGRRAPGEEAALRDLGRARAETLRALKAATFPRNAWLLRHASRATGRAPWRPAPLRWRSAVGWAGVGQPSVCQAYVRAVTDHPARLAPLAHALLRRADRAARPGRRRAPGAPRGAGTVAVTPGAARGDLPRFDPPRQLMHSRGFTPSADSTRERRPQGGRTKPGHRQARRALGAGAWASRSPATMRRHRP